MVRNINSQGSQSSQPVIRAFYVSLYKKAREFVPSQILPFLEWSPLPYCESLISFAVPGVVSALDSLLADMEAFSGDKKEDGKAKDLETKVDLLTDKLKTAFDPKTDMTNFRWSLSEPDIGK